MSIEAAAELFFTYLEHERGCSAATSTAYGSDVDLRSGWLKVRNRKGGRPRSVPLVREVGDVLWDWLEFRPAVDHDCLFTGLGERLWDARAWRMCSSGRPSVRGYGARGSVRTRRGTRSLHCCCRRGAIWFRFSSY